MKRDANVTSESDRRSALTQLNEDLARTSKVPVTPQTAHPAYRLPYVDPDFMRSDPLRGVRLQLELEKPESLLRAAGIESTVVMFGGARIPPPAEKSRARTPVLAELSRYYDEARLFARWVTEESLKRGGGQLVICTGGGPGVMEAGNLGAEDAGGRSIGLNIVLPHEQAPNLHVTPSLSFNFHYFAIRKMHFLMRAKAIAVFPGGFGTLDELFETLTLIQTQRMECMPVLLFGVDFWRRIVNWEALAEAGTISNEDLTLFNFVETAEEALAAMEGRV
ncbi:LOG family protein [Paludibacillus litoralis]|uniref:LOG family protein n=1 Tax=Paludibacillus litoralis TaxID=3133267 RepID=UPI0039B77C5C